MGKSIKVLSSLVNVRTQGRATQSLSLISANALFASSPYHSNINNTPRFRIFRIPALSYSKISLKEFEKIKER